MSRTDKQPHTTLTLAQVDRAGELACKARAITACIRAASMTAGELPDDAIPGACWAVEDIIAELGELCRGAPKPVRMQPMKQTQSPGA